MKKTIQRTPKVFSSRSPVEPVSGGFEINFRALRPFLLLVVLIGALFFIEKLPILRIKHIEIIGDNDAAVKENLESLKGHSILSRKTSSLVKQINNKNYNVDVLKCRLGLPDTLKCNLKTKIVAIYWKQDTTGTVYQIDEEGFVFGQTDVPSQEGIIVRDQSSLQISLGQRLLDNVSIENLILLNKLLSQAGIKCESFSIINITDFIIANVNNYTVDGQSFAKNLKVYFNRTGSIENQVSSLQALLKAKHELINERIDLRVAGVAYYQ